MPSSPGEWLCEECSELMMKTEYGFFHDTCRLARIQRYARRVAEEEVFDALKHAKEL